MTLYVYVKTDENTRCIAPKLHKKNEGGTDSEASSSFGSGLISIVPNGRGVGSCFTSAGGAGSDSSGTSAR